MDVSFIIPVYNHLDLTVECLRSLQETVEGVDYEVILVNDGSDSETAAGLRELATGQIRLIENPGNCGYAHSNNHGALEAKGKILFLLNNDLVLLPGWFEPMYAAFQKRPKLGLCGNVQLNATTSEIDHAGAYVAANGTIEHRREQNKSVFGTPSYSRFHFATGACCAIKRELYLKVGGLDEAFINGGEDADLCLRLKVSGYQICISNRSIIKHHVSATRKETSLNDERNSRLLQRRWAEQLASLSAAEWPDKVVSDALKVTHFAELDWQILKSAVPRYLTLKRGPAPEAVYLASCEQERKERNWRSILDGLSDDMIKEEERKQHAAPLTDRYEYNGLFTFLDDGIGVWIRETATLSLPRGMLIDSIRISGHLREPIKYLKEEHGKLGLSIKVSDAAASTKFPLKSGDFEIDFCEAPARASEATKIEIRLLGVERSNTFAYVGRKIAKMSPIPARIRNYFGKYRPQRLNKRLSIYNIAVNGEDVFNFAKDSTNPLNTEFALKHARLGINLVGWFKAELGIGESARLAAKALKHSAIPHSLVPLKVNCLASQGDSSLDSEFTSQNQHPINVFHIDAPQSPDIDHFHGPKFRKGKYNIAYWAWELPDFPDQWTQYFRYFDEIWVPSHFVRESISIKSPLPVITVPHCIDFSLPDKDYRELLGLPSDKFLFNFAYDLNSYQERKNPKAAIEAFKLAFQGSDLANDVGLVIKIHSSKRNQGPYKELLSLLEGVPNVHLIDKTLSREMTYGLMHACDSYLSLHRAEGFGLTVAESMHLGKPVISTNWSATSEFVNATNGCPVDFKLVELKKNHGPYKKGQLWADPDPQHAAEYMKRLATDAEYARELGEKARETIFELFSPDRVFSIYRKRLRSIALW